MSNTSQVKVFSITKEINPNVQFGQEYADFQKEIIDKLNEESIHSDPNDVFSEMKSEGNVIEFTVYRRVNKE